MSNESADNRNREHDRVRLSELGSHDDRGLVCPDCGCRHFTVFKTRRKQAVIVRLRDCRHCGRRIQTSERITG